MTAPFSLTAMVSELVAQAIFVFVCTGAATGSVSPFTITGFDGKDMNAPVPWVQEVSMTFGFCITVLAYATGGKSGAQINGAVTLGLAAAGELAPVQAVANIVGQLVGSCIGSGLLSLVVREGSDRTGGLGSNGVGPGYSPKQAFLGEAIMVFLLMYTVLETACCKKNKGNAVMAPIAIGFAVYLGHVVLIPIDGCSLNPTRSFGPAVVANAQGRNNQSFKDFWVFVIGPVTGALVAVAYYKIINMLQDNEAENDPAVDVDRADAVEKA